MSKIVKEYQNRQEAYTHDYTIEYHRQSDGTYKIVAPECPDDPFDNDARTHHRYESGTICVTEGKEPRSLEMAEAIAHYWMSRYSEYVRTGEFDNSGGRVST